MPFRYGLMGGVMLIAAGIAGAQAQSPRCLEEFAPLREKVESHQTVVKATLAKRSPNAVEACAQLTKLYRSQLDLLIFIRKNNNPSTCPFPPELVSSLEALQASTESVRKDACGAASNPRTPLAPRDDGVPLWPKGRIGT